MKSLLVMLTLLTFIVSSVYALNEPEDSLVLYFSFDEVDGNNTIDHSKYKNHGQMKGTPKLVEGKFGKALQLNGQSDWVEIPHHETLTVDKDVTVMAWIHTERHEGPTTKDGKELLQRATIRVLTVFIPKFQVNVWLSVSTMARVFALGKSN